MRSLPRAAGPLLTVAAILGVAGLSVAQAPGKPRIQIVSDKAGRPIAFEAAGLPLDSLKDLSSLDQDAAAFVRLLSISVIDEDVVAGDRPPVVGKYAIDGATLRFTPRFPFRPGVRYRVVLYINAASGIDKPGRPQDDPGKTVTREVTVPDERPAEPAEVARVDPVADVLPENLLRFYIHFSAPMGRGEAYEHVRLLDSRGEPLEVPFLELSEELWDAGARRLTLLIDPGRIKRGLKPREDLGPVLEAGRDYTLVIDRTWRDASGRALKADFKKRFRVVAPIESAIDPAKWKIDLPPAGSTAALVIHFPYPLDHALLERTIRVADAGGVRIRGNASALDEDRQWEFRPASPWRSSAYRLLIDADLEDVAGNRVGRPFETDEAVRLDVKAQAEVAEIPFKIAENPR